MSLFLHVFATQPAGNVPASYLDANFIVAANAVGAINVKNSPYNAVGDGVADDTAAIQAAITASFDGVNQCVPVYFPQGTYFVSSPITLPLNAFLLGAGPENTRIYRTGDYGNTFVGGNATDAAGAISADGIWFQHGPAYVQGNTILTNLATSGAWFLLYGSQESTFRNCYFWRLPYHVNFKGGTLSSFENCSFVGIWDNVNAGCQEGIANIFYDVHATHGNCKDSSIINCTFSGATSASRSVTINGTPVMMNENIGTRDAISIYGLETLSMVGGLAGGQNSSCVAIANKTNSNIANLRFNGVFFDSARVQMIYAQTQNASFFTHNLIFDGCTFNGELNGFKGINILKTGSSPSVYAFTVTGCTLSAMFGSPMTIEGAIGGTVADNVLTNWNCLGVGGIDLQYTAAAWVTGVSSRVRFSDNTIGGGGNTFSAVGAPDNFCLDGIVIDSANSALSCVQEGTINAGITTFAVAIAVADLPPAAANQGVRLFVNNATSTTFASVVAGTGANVVPVYSDGTNWRIG